MDLQTIQDMDLNHMFHIQLVFLVIVNNIDHHKVFLLNYQYNELVVNVDQSHMLYYTKNFQSKQKIKFTHRTIFLLFTSPNCLTSQIYDDILSNVDNGRIFEQIVLL